MSKPVKISTVLTRAAKYIEEHGLAKGSYFKYRNGRTFEVVNDVLEDTTLAMEKGCKACAWGGLYVGAAMSAKDSGQVYNLSDQASQYVLEAIGVHEGEHHIPFWNDHPARTKDEVVAALKDAAKAARKDGK